MTEAADQDAVARFKSALGDLWKLAGEPPIGKSNDLVPASTFSDWRSPVKPVPKDPERLARVVLQFQTKARSRSALTRQERARLDQLGVEQLETLRSKAVDSSHPVRGHEQLERLRELTGVAVADAGQVMQPDGRFPGGIALAELHVRRELEAVVLGRIMDGTAQLVVGDPGCGKTTFLWSLFRELTEQDGIEPFFIRAPSLAARPPGIASASATVGVSDLGEALSADIASGATPVLLVDTLDALAHSPSGAALAAALLIETQRLGVSVVMTCRPGESRLLKIDNGDSTDASPHGEYLRPQLHLGAYSADERAAAIAGHSRVYCPDTLHGEGAARRLELTIMNAVYQDLPLSEVCDSPLNLRLLFDVYTPDPPVNDIDVASLYDRVKRMRVMQDARPGGGSTFQTAAASKDLVALARALARYMLATNELEIDQSLISHHLENLLPGQRWDGPNGIAADLLELTRRGVIAQIPGSTRVRFFHQTFFEYMAADFLRAEGKGRQLIDRILANPHDLVLAAVAGQLVPREPPGKADELLAPLLATDELAWLGLELYAQVETPGWVAPQAREQLRSAAEEPVKRFLAILPSRRRRQLQEWSEDLSAAWNRGGQGPRDNRTVRIQMLESLCRLIRQDPTFVLNLIIDLNCVDWLLAWNPIDLSSHDRLYLRLLRRSFRHDPAWTLSSMERFWSLFNSLRLPAPLADLVRAATEEADGIDNPAAAMRARKAASVQFERLVERRTSAHQGDASEPLERALGGLRASNARDLTAAQRLSAILRSTSGDLDSPISRAYLYEAGVLANGLDADSAAKAIDTLLSVDEPRKQSTILDLVIVPTLSERAPDEYRGTGRSNPSPFAKLLDETCRAALERLPAPIFDDGSRSLSGLFIEAVRRANPKPAHLLRLLPLDPPSHLWLRNDGLGQLVLPAAIAGHAGAQHALEQWTSDRGVHDAVDSKTNGSLRTAFQEHVAEHPELLQYLSDEAILTQDTGTLVAALSKTPAPDACQERLRALAASLVKGDARQRRHGYRLITVMVDHGSWNPPDGRSLASELAANPGYPLRITLLEAARSAVVSNQWTFTQAEWLLAPLAELAQQQASAVSADATHRATTRLARSVLVAILCRLSPIEDPAIRDAATRRLISLTVPAPPTGGALNTEDVRELGRLFERVSKLDSTAASHLLMTVSQALHAYDPRESKPKREIANRWETPLTAVLTRLGPIGQRDLVLGLTGADIAIARRMIAVFAQLQESSIGDPPLWFRELGHRRDINPKLRQTVNNRLRLHVRTRCGGPWPELLDPDIRMTC